MVQPLKIIVIAALLIKKEKVTVQPLPHPAASPGHQRASASRSGACGFASPIGQRCWFLTKKGRKVRAIGILRLPCWVCIQEKM